MTARRRRSGYANVGGTPECEYCHRGEARPDVARSLSLHSPETKPDVAGILATRPPCACGCGDLVGVAGEQYIPGHRPRQVVAESEERAAYALKRNRQPLSSPMPPAAIP